MYEPTIKVRHAAQSLDQDAKTQVSTSSRRRVTGHSDVRYARKRSTPRRTRPWPIAALAIVAVVLVLFSVW